MEMQTMTIGAEPQGKDSELEKLMAANEELKERCAAYADELRRLRESFDNSYMRGRVDGLEFAIRCNGVSGGEVRK